MSIIDEYIDAYDSRVREFEEEAAASAAVLRKILEESGIRAFVSHRAKDARSLEAKLRKREGNKAYKTFKDIEQHIVDLSGVRIALYFPGQIGDVRQVIEKEFSIKKEKSFPDGSHEPAYSKRFSGYWAKHFRGRRRGGRGRPNVEIQVASVLMHAWAEVEHDLVYKPQSEKVSSEEAAILDELNGLVLAGEIALERLQRAKEQELLSKSRNSVLGKYLMTWIELERVLREHDMPVFGRMDSTGNRWFRYKRLHSNLWEEFSVQRRIRNQIVHGEEFPDGDYLEEQIKVLNRLFSEFNLSEEK